LTHPRFTGCECIGDTCQLGASRLSEVGLPPSAAADQGSDASHQCPGCEAFRDQIRTDRSHHAHLALAIGADDRRDQQDADARAPGPGKVAQLTKGLSIKAVDACGDERDARNLALFAQQFIDCARRCLGLALIVDLAQPFGLILELIDSLG